MTKKELVGALKFFDDAAEVYVCEKSSNYEDGESIDNVVQITTKSGLKYINIEY